MFSRYSSQKLKVNLRLAIQRLKLLEKKKTEEAQKARREIADYLVSNKIDRARIRVEHIIREDYLVEAMEILELYCDLLLARFGLLDPGKDIEEGLVEAVSTLIWASPRLQGDIGELKVISEQLGHLCGKENHQQYKSNAENTVNEKVLQRLGVHTPPASLVENYLIEIARSYNVEYQPDPTVFLDDEERLAESHHQMNILKPGEVTGGGTVAPTMPPMREPNQGPLLPMPDLPQPFTAIPPPESRYPPQPPGHQPADSFQLNLPDIPSTNIPGASVGGNSENVDFDDLTRRFEELKKRK